MVYASKLTTGECSSWIIINCAFYICLAFEQRSDISSGQIRSARANNLFFYPQSHCLSGSPHHPFLLLHWFGEDTIEYLAYWLAFATYRIVLAASTTNQGTALIGSFGDVKSLQRGQVVQNSSYARLRKEIRCLVRCIDQNAIRSTSPHSLTSDFVEDVQPIRLALKEDLLVTLFRLRDVTSVLRL